MMKDKSKLKPFSWKSMIWIFGFFVFLVLSIILISTPNAKMTKSLKTVPVDIYFIGEYSLNGEDYRTYSGSESFNAIDGDLYLRGHFDYQPSKANVHFFFDNITLTFVADGEIIYENSSEKESIYTGSSWHTFQTTSLTSNSIEIHLSNDSSIGNPRAYNDFLSNMYIGANEVFENYILYPSDYFNYDDIGGNVNQKTRFLSSGELWRFIGQASIVISFLLLGLAITDSFQYRIYGKKLWIIMAVALANAGIIIFDTKDVSIWFDSLDSPFMLAQLFRMTFMMMLSLLTLSFFKGKKRYVLYALFIIQSCFFVGYTMDAIIRNTYFSQGMLIWYFLQVASFFLVMTLLIMEMISKKQKRERLIILPLLLIWSFVGIELLNARIGFFQRGMILEIVTILMLISCVLHFTMSVSKTFKAVQQVDYLEKELLKNQVAIVLSQIQPHFLFNSLNTIQYLCKTDPEEASNAVMSFSKYLRGNMDSLDQKAPIPFENDLEHLNNYLSLEKLRFPDIEVEFELKCTNFTVPVLTLQPLVENAIKHGLSKIDKEKRIKISTNEDEQNWYLVIEDNGSGFDIDEISRKDGRSHIGIMNTRQRLKAMCNGDLIIKSIIGKGTTITIIIPKEKLS